MTTKSELIRRRNALYDLERACSSMESAGIPCDALKLSLEDLQSEVVTISVPCLLCARQFVVPVLVGSYSMPESTLCTACDQSAASDSEPELSEDDQTAVLLVTDEPAT